MPSLYSVKKAGDKIVVESQNANAKQVLCGWGSDRDAVDGSFYGRDVPGAWGPNHELRWRWVLTPAAVSRMLANLHTQLTDPDYVKDGKAERSAALELQRKLRAVAPQRAARLATSPHARCHDGRCLEHEINSQVPSCAERSATKGRRRGR